MEIKVDKKRCIGCGACFVIAPQSFRLGEDGKSEPVEPAGDDEKTIEEAVQTCPVAAISIKDSK